VTWAGVEPLGDRDGRIALYLTDHLAKLLPPKGALPVGSGASRADEGLVGRETQMVAFLHRNGASFFGPLHEAAGGGFPQETVDAIWDLVWKGLLTNDTLHALRAYSSPPERTRRPGKGTTFRSRRLIPPSAEGRWTLVPSPSAATTTWAAPWRISCWCVTAW
jgi:ATP-dependent Lhr-like helicase